MKKLNLVNEKGEVVGEATREEIHQKGLLHAEIHVWFFTPNGELIFQHRGKNKDTFPDLLDATVGGHIEIGRTALEAATEETLEETGLKISEDDLIPISINITSYRFTGNVSDLKVEGNDKCVGFEVYSINTLLNLDEEEKKKFISLLTEESMLSIYKKIQELT